MLSQIPGIVWVAIGVGLAIAAPWMLFVALDRQGRDKTGQVFQASVDSIRKTMSGEAKEMDELSRRVEALKQEENNPERGAPK